MIVRHEGKYVFPDQEKEQLDDRMNKLLNYGGMMNVEEFCAYGHSMGLLKPVMIFPGGKARFNYNYFEDCAWNPVEYDSKENYFGSREVGCEEFFRVILAAYVLCELYDDGHGVLLLGDDYIGVARYVAWINHLFGEKYTVDKHKLLNFQWELKRNSVDEAELNARLTKYLGSAGNELPYSMKTVDFLRINYNYKIYSGIEELHDKPEYYLSDNERLFWWDGSDEVIISEKIDLWMKKLADRHKQLMQIEKFNEKFQIDSHSFSKSFVSLLVDLDKTYRRISPFQTMFYEFLRHGNQKEYQAAVVLLRELAEENKEEGRIIMDMRGPWCWECRKRTFNQGRLNIKRYMSIMSNLALRKKYFDF